MNVYCEHDHLADQCERCSLVRAMERGYVPARPAVPQPGVTGMQKVQDTYALAGFEPVTEPTRPTVSEDTVIERPELGEGVETFVVAGDPIPVGLEDHHRRPAPRRGATRHVTDEAGGDVKPALSRQRRRSSQPASPSSTQGGQ